MKKSLFPALVAFVALSSCTKIVQTTVYETTTVYDTVYVSHKTEVYDTVRHTTYIVDTVNVGGNATAAYSIQSFGVLPTNSPKKNRNLLQNAIDEASKTGMALFVDPVENGYPVAPGLVLKPNVSLIGNHGPTGRGTVNKAGDGPTGSVFIITDDSYPFIRVQSSTKIAGVQFYYPNQAVKDTTKVIAYPPTIQVDKDNYVAGVTLQDLTFYGEYFAMDFRARENYKCELIHIENCYGYPLSGQFIALQYCWDVPRILHCHVNPGNQRLFQRGFDGVMQQYVCNKRNYTYWIENTDNAQCIDIFTFGNYGGIYLGPVTYGQLTNFNFDCVCIGVYKGGNGNFNRVWEVSQGAIIANFSPDCKVANIHPFYVTGYGHLSIANVDCFSGKNGPAYAIGRSNDYIKIVNPQGVYNVVTGVNCRMRNYESDCPITVDAPSAKVSFINCADKNGHLYEFKYEGPYSD